MQQVNEYDFKGSPLETQQQLLDDPTITDADWNGIPPALSAEFFTSSVTYDALNRPVTTTDPGNNVHEFTYDKGGLLKSVKLNTNNYVNDIHPLLAHACGVCLYYLSRLTHFYNFC